MTNQKCPVCAGWQTSSGRANLMNHIKNHAKSELLKKFLIGDKIKAPHAMWLKTNAKIQVAQAYIVKVKGGQRVVINL